MRNKYTGLLPKMTENERDYHLPQKITRSNKSYYEKFITPCIQWTKLIL